MKPRYSIQAMVAASALLVAGHAGIASAHNQRGALTKKINAIDVYQITCTDDGNGPPDHLVVAVRDRAPVKPPLVSVQIRMGDSVSPASSDRKDGDKFFSPEVGLTGGAGPYIVTVSKLKKKPSKPDKSLRHPEIYDLQYHCMTRFNVHTGSPDRLIANPNQ